MAASVGIDLGTTNSVVCIKRRGVIEPIKIDGKYLMPSIASFKKGSNVLVGTAAKSRLLLAPDETIASVKRSMGNDDVTYRIDGMTYTPIEISATILKRIVSAASDELGEKITRAVITVPAYFNEKQKEATRKAGELAGLTVLRLLPEPTAAAIAYAKDLKKDQIILVYDLGGGTFDVSILKVRGNSFDVLAVGGDTHLGGDDFDDKIIVWAHQQFLNKTGFDLRAVNEADARLARQKLREAAERAKVELSESSEAPISIPDYLGNHSLEVTLTRSEYNKMIRTEIDKTLRCIDSTLADAKLTPSAIDRVILVGGSTRNALVTEVLTQRIKQPYKAEHVDEMVARGAAVVAAEYDLPEGAAPDVVFHDVTGHSLGIGIFSNDKEICQILIPRQTQYPCTSGTLGFTRIPFQPKVVVEVLRGESTDPALNTKLGQLEMNVIPRPGLQPVAALFHLNQDGILEFTAVALPECSETDGILSYAEAFNGSLNVQAVENLIRAGKASPQVVHIKAS